MDGQSGASRQVTIHDRADTDICFVEYMDVLSALHMVDETLLFVYVSAEVLENSMTTQSYRYRRLERNLA